MNKSLYELAQEYEKSISAMNECADKIKKEKRQARIAGDTDAFKLLSAKLFVIYEEIRDMKIVAENLKHYYDTEQVSGECA